MNEKVIVYHMHMGDKILSTMSIYFQYSINEIYHMNEKVIVYHMHMGDKNVGTNVICIKQGYPLSSNLFSLCLDKLQRMI